MQALMRMRFGPYTFLQNPAQLQVENRALQQEERLLSGGVCVTPAGRRATVITGKGWWYGAVRWRWPRCCGGCFCPDRLTGCSPPGRSLCGRI